MKPKFRTEVEERQRLYSWPEIVISLIYDFSKIGEYKLSPLKTGKKGIIYEDWAEIDKKYQGRSLGRLLINRAETELQKLANSKCQQLVHRVLFTEPSLQRFYRHTLKDNGYNIFNNTPERIYFPSNSSQKEK